MASHSRVDSERQTIEAMIALACRDWHGTKNGLCADCQELFDYSCFRLAKCPYKEEKPTCEKCPIHCYRPDQRRLIREVMRYAGPRILLEHPILAVKHMIASRRPVPPPRSKRPKRPGAQASPASAN